MAKYDKDTKFYWLILNENFFDEDSISWLEEQGPNGRDYAYFYLKLCLKALSTNGILIRKVGQVLVPYDNKKLSEMTKMDFDTVTIAMGLLEKIGLVQILINGEIYLPQLEKMIGSKSKGAFKKQQQREAIKLGVDKCLPKCPPESELESEIEDRLDINNKINILNNAREKILKELQIVIADSKLEELYQKMLMYQVENPVEYIVSIVKNEVNKNG